MKILGNNILILADKKEESSVIITDTDTSPTGYAVVVSVGKEVSEVNVGDKIFYNNKAGRFILVDEVEHLLITEFDVFIILGK